MSLRFKIGASAINGLGLHTMQALSEGEIVFDLKKEGLYNSLRNKYTIEVGGEHFYHGRAQFINHSFDANLTVDESGIMYANRNIPLGDELTFDYTTTESEFAGDFDPRKFKQSLTEE